MSPRSAPRKQVTRRGLPAPVRRATRYDLVLAVIPAAFVFAAVLAAARAVPGPAAAAAAAVVGLLAVVDALFLNPPRGPASGGSPA